MLRIQRTDFARLLAATTKVVESRNTIPILSTVRLVADGGKLTATATDLDIEIQSSVPATGELSVCVDAKLLAGIVGKVTGEEVTIEPADSGVVIKAGRSRFDLQTLPVGDFPSFSADGFTATFDVDLAALFAPVSFAISTEEARYYLNGIYLAGQDDKLVAVATDGHRLSRHYGAAVGEFAGVIVPRKMVGIVPKGTVTVALSDTKFRVTAGQTVIASKLIDGTFPDYQRVIPTGNDNVVTFDAPAMRLAAERVSVVSSERGSAIKVSFAAGLAGEGTATLAVNNPDAGSATEEIAIKYDGAPIDVGFNASYLSELISIFPAGEVKLALADGGAPTLFTSDKAPGLLCVLMQMRVRPWPSSK